MKIRPGGLSICFASLGLHEFQVDDFDRSLALVEETVKELVDRQVDAIVYTGTPLTASRGPFFNQELRSRMQTWSGGIPVATDSGLVLLALRALGANRVSLVTPYKDEIVASVVRVVEAHGFTLAASAGKDLRLAELLTGLDHDSVSKVVEEVFEMNRQTDAFYISCPQWPIVDNISTIESTYGLPVVTQLGAIMWWVLSTLSIPKHIAGYGYLLENMPPAPSPFDDSSPEVSEK